MPITACRNLYSRGDVHIPTPCFLSAATRHAVRAEDCDWKPVSFLLLSDRRRCPIVLWLGSVVGPEVYLGHTCVNIIVFSSPGSPSNHLNYYCQSVPTCPPMPILRVATSNHRNRPTVQSLHYCPRLPGPWTVKS